MPLHPYLIASDNSVSRSLPAVLQENSDSQPARLPDSPEHPNIKLKPIPTTSRGRPPGVKNQVESWKNTAAYAWKPASKIKIESDPDSIASRIKQRHEQQEPQIKHDAVEPDMANISAMCGDQSQQ